MRLPSGQHLGYCTNVHPYADLSGLLAALTSQAAPLRQRLAEAGLLAAGASLGVGLWLPAGLARDVAADPEPLRARLLALGLYAFTVNAFPYGDFHGGRVKDEVFRPTWAQASRVDYTLLAAEALAALLPEGETGSVSTHTGGYKPWGDACPSAQAVGAGLLRAAAGLAALEERTGRRIVLGLEPEPLSLLETTAEVVDFFETQLWPHGDVPRRHLGLCWDTCHQAVEFEDARTGLAMLARAGIGVAKVQLSSALSVNAPGLHVAELERYAEDRWFHQVLARTATRTPASARAATTSATHTGPVRRWADLSGALAELRADPQAAARACDADTTWRIHFHVPLFAERLGTHGELHTTRAELAEVLSLAGRAAVTPQLEIETYSYAMIPAGQRAALGAGTLIECLQREFAWVLEHLRRGT